MLELKVTEVLGQIDDLGVLIDAVAVVRLFTCMVIVDAVAVFAVRQFALLVNTKPMTSPLANPLEA